MPSPPLDLPRGAHVFVDETKARGYLMVATWVSPADVARVRRELHAFVPSGAHRVHFKKLTDTQRRAIVATMCELGVVVSVVASSRGQRRARDGCVRVVAAQARDRGARRIVFELDAPYIGFDVANVLATGAELEVQHLRAAEEPVLWVSDAVGWCLQRGGPWLAAVSPIVVRPFTIT